MPAAVAGSELTQPSVLVRWMHELGAAVLVGALLVWLAFRDGGYFPDTWNVGALLLFWLVVVVLLWRGDVALGRLDAALVIGLASLVLWTCLSALWSIAPATSVLEGERALLYLAGIAAVLVVVSRSGARSVAIAVLAAASVVSSYALIDRLVAVNALPYNRLGGPVGYWNALGMVAVAGVCLALAVVAHEPRRLVRAAAAFAVPILVGTLYLTFSRGSWLALGAGLAVSAAVDSRKRELAGAAGVLVLPCVVVLVSAASGHALTTPAAPQGAVAADAHRVAIAVLLMSAVSARLAILAPRLSSWLPQLAPRRFLAAGVACAVVVAVFAAGGPTRLPGVVARGFDAAPPNSANNLNTHLLSLSGSSRGELWRVALRTFARHPLVGNGAGTYGRLWLMMRPEPLTFEDAHNVYLETLTELGTVGLALMLAVLAVPLIAARAAFGRAYIPALTAVYTAFLAHAAIDWDWEMPVVTMSELVCGAAIVAAARGDLLPLRRSLRVGGLAAALGVGALTLVLLVGNRDLSSAAAAAANGQNTLNARARAAQNWAPWSPDPPRWLATVQLDDGNRTAARRLLNTAIGKDRTDWSLWLEIAAASNGQARRTAIAEAVRLDPKGPELFQAAVQYGLIAQRRSQGTSAPSHRSAIRNPDPHLPLSPDRSFEGTTATSQSK